jgi:hypothetical protein
MERHAPDRAERESLASLSSHPLLVARFLEANIGTNIRVIAHLRGTRQLSDRERDGLFTDWIQRVQAHSHLTLGWIRADEDWPLRHLHSLLLAAQPLDPVIVADCWRRLVAPRSRKCARVDRYELGAGGLAYALKAIYWNRCEVRLSDNLDFFGIRSPDRPHSSARRRQLRRVRQQMQGPPEGDDRTVVPRDSTARNSDSGAAGKGMGRLRRPPRTTQGTKGDPAIFLRVAEKVHPGWQREHNAAESFLLNTLKAGPRPITEVVSEGAIRGLSRAGIFEAAESLFLVKYREEGDKQKWELVAYTEAPSPE